MNEECLKCYFEHLIFQKPLYWDGNAFLVHETSSGSGHETGSGPGSPPACSPL